jgi:hypothetical protein
VSTFDPFASDYKEALRDLQVPASVLASTPLVFHQQYTTAFQFLGQRGVWSWWHCMFRRSPFN